VVTRYREERNIVKAVLSTGAAVALCSLTTIIGYGSLLAARNQALQGFGAMAILGELACLTAAIVAMPALVLWWRGRRRGTVVANGVGAEAGEPQKPEADETKPKAGDVRTGTAL
jgi:uncharacterized membrane protein